jgi:hypothetical protein
MRSLRWIALSCSLAALNGCSSCNERPSPPTVEDAGIVAVALDAGNTQAQNLPPSTPSTGSDERPLDYPAVDDAPDWVWPIVQVTEEGGHRKLVVVGWSKNIANPQLATSVAQTKARANLVKALQEKAIIQPGASEGLVSNAVPARTFRSRSGAVFSAVEVELP